MDAFIFEDSGFVVVGGRGLCGEGIFDDDGVEGCGSGGAG